MARQKRLLVTEAIVVEGLRLPGFRVQGSGFRV